MDKIAIFGAGGFGLEVAMLIEQINQSKPFWDIVGFFDDNIEVGTLINGYPTLGGVQEISTWSSPLNLVIAVGNPSIKMKIVNSIKNENVTFPTIIHPNVIMGKSEFVHIGEGSIVCAGNILTTNIEIGDHVILNLACTVGHNTKIGSFCSFMPSCNISGDVIIGTANFWGTGSKIINQKKVGDGVIVGAGAVVTRDIPDHVVAVGVPAKVIKSNK